MSLPPLADPRQMRLGDRLRALARGLPDSAVELVNRLRLPTPTVLPVTGAVVGVYSGLAAGLFSSLVGLMSGLFYGLPRVAAAMRAGAWKLEELWSALASARWHTEFAIVGVPIALSALLVVRQIRPGGPRDEVRRRLRVLALLMLAALGLYYPLVGLSALNTVYGPPAPLHHGLGLPFWAVLLLPVAGGAVAGRLLKARPELHGHGTPQVIQAVRQEAALDGPGGLLKLMASAVTIGSGGSAGREGPIVYGGAAFASAVGKTLGFSRRELAILLASGAGAGIAASFNAPVAGAIFGMEIILREFELKVFSPIILASVTATMVGRGVMGTAPMLRRLSYAMTSGWEIVAYAVLGLGCGLLAHAFIRFLHLVEAQCSGEGGNALSRFLGGRSLSARAALGGLVAGGLALASPAVWGTGHESLNLAAEGKLPLYALLLGCVLKLVATGVTIGSGGSGGTFFPMIVVGGLGGGAFGAVLHHVLPGVFAPNGAYALVGMGAAVAGLNRAPLTGMMMLYELSGNYSIILPLMVTCTIASALCHFLTERRQRPPTTDAELLRSTPVRALMRRAEPVSADTPVRELVDMLVASKDFALPVRDLEGKLVGVVQMHHIQEVWPDPQLTQMLNAWDVAQKVPLLDPEVAVTTAVDWMDENDIDVLPVVQPEGSDGRVFLITRTAVRRYLLQRRAAQHRSDEALVAPTEMH